MKKYAIKIIWIFLFSLIIFSYGSEIKSLYKFLLIGGGDFAGYYTVGKIALIGKTESLYELETQKFFSPFLKKDELPFLPYFHPPYEALIFIPFALLGYLNAFLAWNIFNVVLLIFSNYLIFSIYKENFAKNEKLNLLSVGIMTFSSLAFFPALCNLINGQDSILLFSLFLLSLKYFYKSRPIVSGLILGLAVFKPHIALLLAGSLIPRSGKKMFFSFFLSATFCALISFFMINIKGVNDFFGLINLVNQEEHRFGVNPSLMPNFRGLLYSWFGIKSTLYGVSIWLAGLLIQILINKDFFKQSDIKKMTTDCISIIIALLCAFHLNMHDLTFMLLPLYISLFLVEIELMKNKTINLKYKLVLLFAFLLLTPIPYNLFFVFPRTEILIIDILFLLIALQNISRSNKST